MAKTVKKPLKTEEGEPDIIVKTRYNDSGQIIKQEKFVGPGDNHIHTGYDMKGRQFYAPEKQNRPDTSTNNQSPAPSSPPPADKK